MALDPNGAPAGYYYEAGATAYLIDPAGTYSLAGASAPTTDPAGTYSGPGAGSPTTDRAGTYSGPGASAATTDPAGTYSRRGASAPRLAAAGTYIPVTGATSAAAQIQDLAGTYSPAGASAATTDPAGTYSADGARAPTTDPAGAYSGPGASAPTTDPAGTHSAARASAPKTDRAGTYSGPGASAATTDPAGTYSGRGASAPTLAAAGTYIPATGSTSAAARIQDPAGTWSSPGASAPTLAGAGTYIPDTGATSVAAETVDPAGTYSPAGASAPTLAGAGTYIPVTGSTSVAAEIADPPGTYSPAGASAPSADPGGTYSAAGASAPTTDPAGTYSSPYALNRLFIGGNNQTPANSVLSFNSATAVANYYGVTSAEASLANEFFAGYSGTSATMLVTRYTAGGDRPHLLGANISTLTLNQLQSISGSLSIVFQGYTYSGSVNLSGVNSFSAAATAIQTALDLNVPIAAVTAGSSITPVSVSFAGSLNGDLLQIASVGSGSIELGADISGPGIAAGSQIVTQYDGTPGGAGLYSLFESGGTVSSETMIESYGVLAVGSVTSGAVAVGEQVTGAGVLPLTAIVGNLSGGGAGSTWLVNNAQTVADENMTMNATPLSVTSEFVIGATANKDYFNVAPNGAFGYDYNPSSLSYMGGTAAAALSLTQASGAINSTPGGELPSAPAFMNNLVQNESSEFGSFQATFPQLAQLDPEYLGALAAWDQSNDGPYQFLSTYIGTTPRAGSSAPTTDPAGTYSLAGATAPTLDSAGTYSGRRASAPTLADPGTYIPVTGATSAAAEIVDSAGSYSLAGASAPTLAQPGYYVPTAGASSETPVSPGYYQPNYGAATEFLALLPTISGTVAGQTTASGQSYPPFSTVTIGDPNTDTSDTLSIQLTDGGGILSDGVGFSGLTTIAPDLYSLSGTAGDITSELDALAFSPSGNPATTTFTLTDTSSAGTDAVDTNTTVTVLPTNANSAESITATSRTNVTFAFAPGFGNDPIQGFAAIGPGNDVLQFETSMFSYLTSGMNQSAEAAALLSHATSSAGNTIISDSFGDSLTLQSVSVATLNGNLGDFKFV